MRRLFARWRLFLAAVAVLIVAGRWYWDQRSATPAQRGARVADRLGCAACHGPAGTRGIDNPGAPGGMVPSWVGGNWMMYTPHVEDVREYILDGVPSRLKDDPAYRVSQARALIHMPAYRGRLTDQELDDLVAYYQAVSGMALPDDPLVKHGYEEALEHGCFGCHGPGGQMNTPNPGSLMGYIPAWSGTDFPELVANDEELKEWIRDGSIQRFRDNPGAAYFLNRQAVHMPGYRGVLSPGDIDAIAAYIRWLRGASAEGALTGK